MAVEDGNFYIMNGSKVFITNAAFADTFVVTAVTDKNKGTRGISSFILEKGMEGYEVGKLLIVNVDDLDFVDNPEHLGEVMNKMEGEINGLL